METAEAYRHCERITWSQARNFAYGIRLLPPDKRRALAAVYAFARRIDDIGDGALPPADKLAALQQARTLVCGMARHAGVTASDGAPTRSGGDADPGGGRPGRDDGLGGDAAAAGGSDPGEDPVVIALTDAVRRFAVPVAAFGELIDGCVADVRGVRYATFDELLGYCRCVAGSIGRLSLGVFGAADRSVAEPLADSLGVALQLTNILRDIREDYRAGRVYLPAEDLDRFGCDLAIPPRGDDAVSRDDAATVFDGPTRSRFIRLIEFEVARARDWYATGLRLLPMLDRRSAACAGAMAGIYARLLDRIAADPAAVLSGRLSLAPWEKAMVAVRALAGRTGGGRPRPATVSVQQPPATAETCGTARKDGTP